MGEYANAIQYGQSRIFVAWQRIIYPDNSALDLGAMPGADGQGEAGFHDQVDNHFVRLFGSALLMSAITGGITYSQNQGQGNNNNFNGNPARRINIVQIAPLALPSRRIYPNAASCLEHILKAVAIEITYTQLERCIHAISVVLDHQIRGVRALCANRVSFFVLEHVITEIGISCRVAAQPERWSRFRYVVRLGPSDRILDDLNRLSCYAAVAALIGLRLRANKSSPYGNWDREADRREAEDHFR